MIKKIFIRKMCLATMFLASNFAFSLEPVGTSPGGEKPVEETVECGASCPLVTDSSGNQVFGNSCEATGTKSKPPMCIQAPGGISCTSGDGESSTFKKCKKSNPKDPDCVIITDDNLSGNGVTQCECFGAGRDYGKDFCQEQLGCSPIVKGEPTVRPRGIPAPGEPWPTAWKCDENPDRDRCIDLMGQAAANGSKACKPSGSGLVDPVGCCKAKCVGLNVNCSEAGGWGG